MHGSDHAAPDASNSLVDGILVFGSNSCLSCAMLRNALVRGIARRADASTIAVDYIDIGSQLGGSGLKISNVPTVVHVSGGKWVAGWEGFAALASESEQDAAVDAMLDEILKLEPVDAPTGA